MTKILEVLGGVIAACGVVLMIYARIGGHSHAKDLNGIGVMALIAGGGLYLWSMSREVDEIAAEVEADAADADESSGNGEGAQE